MGLEKEICRESEKNVENASTFKIGESSWQINIPIEFRVWNVEFKTSFPTSIGKYEIKLPPTWTIKKGLKRIRKETLNFHSVFLFVQSVKLNLFFIDGNREKFAKCWIGIWKRQTWENSTNYHLLVNFYGGRYVGKCVQSIKQVTVKDSFLFGNFL